MELGFLDRSNLEQFGGFLTPEVGKELAAGRPVTALGLIDDQVACGAVAFWARGAILELLSLYVAPAYRRRGGGRLLLEAALDLGRTRCALATVEYDTLGPEYETLPPFLEAMGFHQDDQDDAIRGISLEAIGQLPFFAGHTGGRTAVPLSRVPEAALRSFFQGCLVRRENYLSWKGLSTGLDRELSMAVLSGGEVVSLLALRPVKEGRLELAWARAADSRHMVVMLRAACAAAVEKLPPETRFITQAVTPASQALLDTLLPGAEPLTQSWTAMLDGRM